MSHYNFQPSLSSQISHELRIPLSAILGLITFLQDTPLTQEQAAYVHDIEASASSLLVAQSKINQLVTETIARS